ncbi:MAG: GtrA family protein [Eubacteriales bacterium]|nr:GtrA family protein [Eubacteriales bacterium]
MIQRLFKLIWQREIITYLIAGVLATLVNLVVFMLLSQVFGPERWYLTNAPAISAALLFAFFTNRWFVFQSKGPVWLEFRRFVGSRILVSLLFEYGAMYLLYNLMGIQLEIPIGRLSLSVSKVLTQFLVVAGNYVMSKLFIFRHQTQDPAHSGNRPGLHR